MSGITAAAALQQAGFSPIVVDKGRTPGGRMSTKRVGDARFDHGAQHFSARADGFAAMVERWNKRGLVHQWYEAQSLTQPERGVEPRWAGVDGMRSIVEGLVGDLDVRTQIKVDYLAPDDQGWSVVAGDEAVIEGAAAVILTPPIPQTRDILSDSNIKLTDSVATALERITYAATLAVMATLDAPSGLADGHLALTEGPIAWMADNQHKGISSVPAVTIHSSESFATQHLEADPEEWTEALVAAAAEHLDGEVLDAVGHRWRFSRPLRALDSVLRVGPADSIILAGEAFAGARVEGAYLSGLDAARQLLS